MHMGVDQYFINFTKTQVAWLEHDMDALEASCQAEYQQLLECHVLMCLNLHGGEAC
jgi:hypothetical protein